MAEIDLRECTGCGACIQACPAAAISLVQGRASIDQGLCDNCRACERACPTAAIRVDRFPVTVSAVLPLTPDPRAAAAGPLVPVPLLSWRQRLVPILAGALAFAGRELLPIALDALAARASRSAGSGAATSLRRATAPEDGCRGLSGLRRRNRGGASW